MGYNQNWLL